MRAGKLISVFGGTLVAALVIGAIALAVISLSSLGQSTETACSGVTVLRNSLVSIMQRSEASLPTLAYYKAHPTELKIVQEQSAADVARLEQVGC